MLGSRFACGLLAVLYFSLAHMETRGDEPWICGTAWVSATQSKGSQLAERRVELFDAVADGAIDVELIAPSAREVWLRVTNKTNELLKIDLPDAFAAVPVLGQIAPPGNFGNAPGGFGQGAFGQGAFGQGGPGMGGQGQGSQGLGGGFNNGGNGVGNLGGGNFGAGNFGAGNFGAGIGAGNLFGNGAGNRMGNGFPGGMFRVPAGRTGKIRAQTVCLEHGKPEPNSRMRYRIVPIEDFNADPRIAHLCRQLGSRAITQNVAQAAAWHIANGLTWEQLAAKDRVQSKYTGNQKFFTSQELQQALRVAEASQEHATTTAEITSPTTAMPSLELASRRTGRQ